MTTAARLDDHGVIAASGPETGYNSMIAGNGRGYDVDVIRKDFPILAREVHSGVPLVYLDNAATSQKPAQVLDAERAYYELSNANVHRGIHVLAEEATALYEDARDTLAAFINAADRSEIVFTRNATEAINLVARSLGDCAQVPRTVDGALTGFAAGGPLGPGDEVVVTEMEHHSNLIPWQLLCQRTGATLKWFGLTDEGRLDLSTIDDVITPRTRLVAFVHQSNILGTLNPVAPIVARAHQVGALVLLDGSQSVPHRPVDVQALGIDLLVATGHKMLGPTGIGLLWGRRELLDMLPPALGGGEMVDIVSMASSTYADPPMRFEAGTPMIAQAVGLAEAVRYLQRLGMDNVAAHEQSLTAYALDALHEVPELTVIGPDTAVDRGGAISFRLAVDGRDVHPHDVGQLLDERGVAVRVGQHCARPVCVRYGVSATTRASFAPYSSTRDVDVLVAALHDVRRFFA